MQSSRSRHQKGAYRGRNTTKTSGRRDLNSPHDEYGNLGPQNPISSRKTTRGRFKDYQADSSSSSRYGQGQGMSRDWNNPRNAKNQCSPQNSLYGQLNEKLPQINKKASFRKPGGENGAQKYASAYSREPGEGSKHGRNMIRKSGYKAQKQPQTEAKSKNKSNWSYYKQNREFERFGDSNYQSNNPRASRQDRRDSGFTGVPDVDPRTSKIE